MVSTSFSHLHSPHSIPLALPAFPHEHQPQPLPSAQPQHRSPHAQHSSHSRSPFSPQHTLLPSVGSAGPSSSRAPAVVAHSRAPRVPKPQPSRHSPPQHLAALPLSAPQCMVPARMDTQPSNSMATTVIKTVGLRQMQALGSARQGGQALPPASTNKWQVGATHELG